MQPRITTLCYIRKGNQYLMLHRIKKQQDENAGKWIGVGGKLEAEESPDECVVREVKEETGLTLTQYDFKGVVTFVSDLWGTEYMMLYEGLAFTGELCSECSEGVLQWVDMDQIMQLNLWEGDRLFLKPMIDGCTKISMKLVYHGDDLVQVAGIGAGSMETN